VKVGLEKKEERWKLYVLGALVVGGALYILWPDDTGSTPTHVTKPRSVAGGASSPETAAPGTATTDAGGSTRRRANGRVAGDFRPKLRDARPENRPDLTKIDPTIKLMLLARVQNVQLGGGSRNIFQFGAAAPVAPTTPIPKVPKIIPGQQVAADPPQKPVNLPPPPEPTAPPIPFKYYGYSNVKGETRKRAFFLDGEDVIVVWEGDTIKNRYKVVHVGLRSVEMEDMQFKNAKQQLPLAEELAG
jgi:hypothetical protein